MKSKFFPFLISILIFLLGFIYVFYALDKVKKDVQSINTEDYSFEISILKNEISDLEDRISDLEYSLEESQAEIQRLKRDVEDLEWRIDY